MVSLINFISYRALAEIIGIPKKNRVSTILIITSVFDNKKIPPER